MLKGRLKPDDEEIIQRNFSYLKEELEARDLLDNLFKNGVMSFEDKIRIHVGKSRLERNDYLLVTLLNSGPGSSFSCFLSALEVKYPHVCERLKTKGKTQDVPKIGHLEIKELLFGGDGKQFPKDVTTVKELGRGAYGTVYLKKFKTSIGEIEIAVKEIHVTDHTNKKKFEDSFRKETSALNQLSHEKIVSYYGYMCTELTYHILIEYMPGGSLSEYILQKTVIDEDKARHITQQILEGIAYIHGKKLFHRDIKTSNILMLDENTVKLADFGLTKEYEEWTISCTDGIGTYRFMAPEMLGSRYNKYVDIWALGCVLLHMLTGKCPYHELKQSQQVMFKLMQKSSPLEGVTTNISMEARQFLEKTFQLIPESRPSAESLLGDTFIKDDTVSTTSETSDNKQLQARLDNLKQSELLGKSSKPHSEANRQQHVLLLSDYQPPLKKMYTHSNTFPFPVPPSAHTSPAQTWTSTRGYSKQ